MNAKPRIIVVIMDGCVVDIVTDAPVEAVIVDYDTDSYDDEELTDVAPLDEDDDSPEMARVVEYTEAVDSEFINRVYRAKGWVVLHPPLEAEKDSEFFR